MNCPVCGTDNADGAFFCRNCTAPMSGYQDEMSARPGPDMPAPPQAAPVPPPQPPPDQPPEYGAAPGASYPAQPPQYGAPAGPPVGYPAQPPEYAAPPLRQGGGAPGLGQPPEFGVPPGQAYGLPPGAQQAPGYGVPPGQADGLPPGAHILQPQQLPPGAHAAVSEAHAFRPMPVSNQRASTMEEFKETWGPLLAVSAGGFVVLRILAEIIVRFYPGKDLLEADGLVKITGMPSPFGIVVGVVGVIAIAVAVGWLAGKLYPTRAVMAGALAGLSVVVLEVVFSLIKLGAVARLTSLSGRSTFNWPYSFMLLIVFVLAGAAAGYGSGGFGMERTETADLKRAVMVVGGVAVGIVLLIGVFGLGIRITKHYGTDDMKRAYAGSDWGASFFAVVPGKERPVSVAYYDFDPTSLSDLSTVKVGYHWAGTWDGKATTVAEISGSLKKASQLRKVAAACPGSPYISPGDGDTYHALVWMDAGYNKVYAISYTLYPSPKSTGVTAKRLDVWVNPPEAASIYK